MDVKENFPNSSVFPIGKYTIIGTAEKAQGRRENNDPSSLLGTGGRRRVEIVLA
jgi:hypothetical protein